MKRKKDKSWMDLKEKIERLHLFELPCKLEDIFLSTKLEEVVTNTTFIIEAVPENLNLKQQWYHKLDALCSQDVILASNTSGFCASEMAIQMRFPERMIVAHFWNPTHLMSLVEVVHGEKTSSEVLQRAMSAMYDFVVTSSIGARYGWS